MADNTICFILMQCNLIRHTYTNVIIKKKRTSNERVSFIDMIEKHHSDDIPIIFTADRGYECYNDMAHVTECGHKFVIRVKDIDSQGITADLGLPDTYFDKSMTLKLTRRDTQKIKEMRKTDARIRRIIGDFDYLPKDYDRKAPAQFYELPIRIVRFKVKNTTEVIMTNLPEEEFSVGEIRKIYAMRWGIETSFRDLKYTIGLNYYHARKSDSILQEIYSRIVMYNFCQLITNNAKIKCPKSAKGRKFAYRINFSQSVQICREFLKNKIKCNYVIIMIEKYILPIHKGKAHLRTKSPRREIYFNYRLA
ncbi:MAG: transposase [Ruminococcus sp.]|nr:transposase [Ruminococcus sp.]